MSLFFYFPETRFAKENPLSEQICHVRSEAAEVFDAYHNEPIERVVEELLDLKHSTETAIRNILMRYPDLDIEDMAALVIKKNFDRGYYNLEGRERRDVSQSILQEKQT